MVLHESSLENYRGILLKTSELAKSVLCDVKFVCQNSQIFHSFRLFLASISPNFFKKIFHESRFDEELTWTIILPEDITYEEVFEFHKCLLSSDGEEKIETMLNSCIDLINLFQVGTDIPGAKVEKDSDPIQASKAVLVCVECGKEYKSEACFRNHVKIHEQEYEALNRSKHQPKTNPKESATSSGRPRREVLKPKRFEDSINKLDLDDDIDNIILKERRKLNKFVCQNCSKDFSSKQCLENHMKLHADERKFECDICKKKFVTEATLNSHKKLHLNTLRSFGCPHCDKKLNNASNLARHVRSVHFELSTDKRQFGCKTCGKLFKDPSALKIHEKIHSGIKPHACNDCSKAFLTNAQLKIHQVTKATVNSLYLLTSLYIDKTSAQWSEGLTKPIRSYS